LEYSFYNCKQLTSINISDTVKSVGSNAFHNCDSLSSMILPNSITSIGDSAFRQCTALTLIEIPDSVTSIGEEAFYNCSLLTSVYYYGIHEPTDVGDDIFMSCNDSLVIYVLADYDKETFCGVSVIRNFYTIKYDLDGGFVYPENPTVCNIETDSFTLANPIKPGCIFKGWTSSNVSGGPFETVNISTGLRGSAKNINFTANWEIIVYNISYEGLDGAVIEENPNSYTVESASFTLNNPSKTACIFKGWAGPALDKLEMNVTIEKGSTENRNYIANWKATAFSIIYEGLDGATIEENPNSYTVESASFTLNNPSKTGYEFIGWTGTGLDRLEMNVTIEKGSTDNRNYIANWEIIVYNISYEGLDGATIEENPNSYTVESASFTLNNPSKTGCEFIGWTGTGLDKLEMDVTIKKGSTDNRNYIANWKATVISGSSSLNKYKRFNVFSFTTFILLYNTILLIHNN